MPCSGVRACVQRAETLFRASIRQSRGAAERGAEIAARCPYHTKRASLGKHRLSAERG